MNYIFILNGIVGVLSFISAASIIYTMTKDKEGKTPIFIAINDTPC